MSWADETADVSVTTRDTFGEPVVFRPGTDDETQLTAIFDERTEEYDAEAGVPVTSPIPRLNVVLSDLPIPPAKSHRFTVRGALYSVTRVEPDGEGNVELYLQRV